MHLGNRIPAGAPVTTSAISSGVLGWNIENRSGVLWAPSDSPYGEQKIGIIFQTNRDILGVMFNYEFYSKAK